MESKRRPSKGDILMEWDRVVITIVSDWVRDALRRELILDEFKG